MKKILIALSTTAMATTSMADVMYTYRPIDDKSKGFIVFEQLTGNDKFDVSGESINAAATITYGEYDLYKKGKDEATLYFRYQDGNFPGEAGEDDDDNPIFSDFKNNIKVVGLKYMRKVHPKVKVGGMVSVADRDPFLEYNGLSYRITPKAEVNVIKGVNVRFLQEIEMIPKSTITDEDTVKGMVSAKYKNSQERAYYVRIGFNELSRGLIQKTGFIKNVEYEQKRANGKDSENPSKWSSKWSTEKFWFVTLNNDVKLYASHIAEYNSVGIIFKF